jgi:hypothetical protein
VRSTARSVSAFVLLLGLQATCKQDHEPQHEHLLHLPPVGLSLTVRFDGRTIDLPLAALAPDASGLPLDAVWKAAWPSEDPLRLSFDLVGSDGFRPTSRPKCTRLLTGAEFVRGRLDAVTHDITYDDQLKLPGCYHVRHVVAIEASR